ncbi:MAG TPA: CoA transferase, partial [Burkholderiaceae bacterium]|nr:CoA transferase [Burkholderiaceae bacterium]
GPLAGVRVLDLTAVVLGPIATQLLGDYGADVIKVEAPEGDRMRTNGVTRHARGMSSIFLAINRNKRSLCIDLKKPAGVAAIKRLLPTVDVLVHNMRLAAVQRLGLGYDAVAAVNPRLVYCVAPGFGQGGPDAAKPAFDDVIQAACGLAALVGTETGKPTYVPSLIADKTAGLALANAVLAALFERSRSGRGQFVEVPMFETMVAFTLAEHLGGRTFEPPMGSAGYQRLLAGGRRPAPTRDGYVAMLPYSGEHWRQLFQRVGRDDIAAKYNFDDRHERNARIREIYDDMASVTGQMSSAECLALCESLDIAATRIHAIDELPEHPHLQAVGLFERTVHPSEGPIVAVRPATQFARTPAALRRPAPWLGEHNDEVLREAGYDDAQIAALKADGVAVSVPPGAGGPPAGDVR